MKYLFILFMFLPGFLLTCEEVREISLKELIVEDCFDDIAISMEEMMKVSKYIAQTEPDIITFKEEVGETAVKQLVYSLHSRGFTEYYYYLENDYGVIIRGEVTF